jgi:hypothetical protein
VRAGVKAFQGTDWSTRRNKVQALRDALRDGGEAVKHFGFKFDATLPEVGLPAPYSETGWADEVCGYFDAIELADWFIPLEA